MLLIRLKNYLFGLTYSRYFENRQLSVALAMIWFCSEVSFCFDLPAQQQTNGNHFEQNDKCDWLILLQICSAVRGRSNSIDCVLDPLGHRFKWHTLSPYTCSISSEKSRHFLPTVFFLCLRSWHIICIADIRYFVFIVSTVLTQLLVLRTDFN